MNRVIGRMSGIMKRALCKKEQGMGVIEIINAKKFTTI